MTQIICQNRLSTQKALALIETMNVTVSGYVLMAEDGRRILVDCGDVRFLSTEEMWYLMHPAQPEFD